MKIGEGSERLDRAGARRLARALLGDSTVKDALNAAIERVGDADAKAMPATVLNFAAEHYLARGRLERAPARGPAKPSSPPACRPAPEPGGHRERDLGPPGDGGGRRSVRTHSSIRCARTGAPWPSAYARNAVQARLRRCDGPLRGNGSHEISRRSPSEGPKRHPGRPARQPTRRT